MRSPRIIAILRGVREHEVAAQLDALRAAGIKSVEIPLNAQGAEASLEAALGYAGTQMRIGAGTVLTIEHVWQLRDSGGELAVMPNADTAVIRAAKEAGLITIPGIATPTEAFAALAAGADALKLFPAELVTPTVLKAIRVVLPKGTRLLPVGGITPNTMTPYLEAGAAGFGLGSALYKPGMTAVEVGATARAFVAAWKESTTRQ